MQARYKRLEEEFKRVHNLAMELSHENDEYHTFLNEHIIGLVKTTREVQKQASGKSDNDTRIIVMPEELFQDLSTKLDSVESDLGLHDSSSCSSANDVLQEIIRLTDSESTGGRTKTRLRL
jgi:hypothetical protein